MDQKQHTFIEKVKATITKHSMLSPGDTVLVCLSGGPDSVCLLTVLHKLREEFSLKLHAVYVDHGLRPGETPEEIAFCRKLCDSLSVPFVTRAIDVKTYEAEEGMNRQEAARELRYRVFDEVFAEIKADRLAMGHTADDQIETFFMRFFRGSGPKGLSGIPPVRARIIRPLIEVERSEIEAFLDAEGTGFMVDSSNLKEDYLRNRLRLMVMPEIRKINPAIAETVSRTMEILRDEERYFDHLVTMTLMKLISRKSDLHIELFLMPLETMDTVVLRRVLRRAVGETRGLRSMGFAHIEAVVELIKEGKNGDRLYLPKGLRAIKNYATLVITAAVPLTFQPRTLAVPGEAVLEEIKAVLAASVQDRGDDFGDGKTVAVFDADRTEPTLAVRPREKGDIFFPMGFGKKRKLQDFFVDMKVPRDERDTVPIVLSGHDVVWIAGYRGDERFRATADTKRFLRLELKRAV
jgi:tRNA(Ile)-lysidine synthase